MKLMTELVYYYFSVTEQMCTIQQHQALIPFLH